jgi:uncharacterized protein (DUF2141 family)
MFITMIKRIIIICSVVTAAIIALPRCANPGSPSGGPKDTIPPILINTIPLDRSTNVSPEKISIYFNEYIAFKDINKKLVISPPLEYKPKIILKGKYLNIKITDTLKDNTTYTFYFDDAIVDNNENNPYPNFYYTFSTGPVVDSLVIGGGVLDAFNHTVIEDVTIGLYKDLNDSVPYKQKPYYVAKSDKESGRFIFRNIAAGRYRVFAMKELNNNMKYDQPGEYIAFTDHFLDINDQGFSVNGKPIEDEKHTLSDSTHTIHDHADHALSLFMFLEDRAPQYLTSDKRLTDNNLQIGFNKVYDDVIYLDPITKPEKEDWYIIDQKENNKDFDIWITDTTMAKRDSIALKMKYRFTNEDKKLDWRTDTIFFVKKKEVNKNRKKDKDKPKPKEYLKLNISANKSKALELFDTLSIQFNEPLHTLNKNRIKLTETVDSVEYTRPFTLDADTLDPRKMYINFNRTKGGEYKIQALPDAFTGISYNKNDTLDVSFKVKKSEDYGQIFLTIVSDEYPMIIQMMEKSGDSEVIVREYYINSETTINIKNVPPKKYLFKSIYDANRNGKWDTGIFMKKIQPEQVRYMRNENSIEEIVVKANWDNELEWNIKLREED